MTNNQETQLRKSRDAIVIFPHTKNLNSFSRRLLLSLMLEAQQQILERKKTGEDFKPGELFKKKLSALVKPIVEKPHGWTKFASDSLLQLRKTEVSIQSPEKKEFEFHDLSLLSEGKLIKEKEDYFFYWAFPPAIFNGLTRDSNFTLISLADISKLSSYASIALYEIASRYENNIDGLTCHNEKEWWVAALSGTRAKKNKVTQNEEPQKLRDWRRFKSEKVMPAINEINAVTKKFTIKLLEPRTDGQIQFQVTPKYIPENLEPTQAHKDAAELGVPAKNITNLLAAGHNVEQLSLAAAKLKSRKNDQTKEPIRNAAAYFSAIALEEVGSSEVLPAPAKVKTPKAPAAEPRESLIVEEVTALSLLRTHILSVSEEIEANYLNKVRANLINNGILTPSATRALDSKNWKTGVIFSKVIEIYATENFGPNWKDLSAADMDYKIKGRSF